MKLSTQALQLLTLVFGDQSNVSFPAGAAKTILEIAAWAKAQQAQPTED